MTQKTRTNTRTKEDRELQSCPFCGGERVGLDAYDYEARVICGGCGARGPVATWGDGGDWEEEVERAKEESRALWQHRPRRRVLEGRLLSCPFGCNRMPRIDACDVVHRARVTTYAVECSECSARGPFADAREDLERDDDHRRRTARELWGEE